jgi:hypothetical protein
MKRTITSMLLAFALLTVGINGTVYNLVGVVHAEGGDGGS